MPEGNHLGSLDVVWFITFQLAYEKWGMEAWIGLNRLPCDPFCKHDEPAVIKKSYDIVNK